MKKALAYVLKVDKAYLFAALILLAFALALYFMTAVPAVSPFVYPAF